MLPIFRQRLLILLAFAAAAIVWLAAEPTLTPPDA